MLPHGISGSSLKALLSKSAESVVEAVIRRDPHEVEYVQSVQEVVHSLEPVLHKYPQYVCALSFGAFDAF